MTDNSLTSFVKEVYGESHLRVEDDLGDGFVRLLSSEAERRQAQHDIRSTEDIVIEMLRNARDAHAHNIFLATIKEGPVRHILMLDDGDGVPESMHERVFEPRVTSKLDSVHMDKWGIHGRGMALYSIAQNTQSARVVCSEKGLGASFAVESNTESLPEKTDQSSFPVATLTEEGKISFRGPKNINRIVSEFAFAHRKECNVYCGSLTDIAATLYAFGKSGLSANARIFSRDLSDIPLCKRLCLSYDPQGFTRDLGELGFNLSERSSRRILDGEIKPLASVYELVAHEVLLGAKELENNKPEREVISHNSSSKQSKTKGLKIEKKHLSHFSDQIQLAFAELAEQYYLESSCVPEIKAGSDEIKIRIPIKMID